MVRIKIYIESQKLLKKILKNLFGYIVGFTFLFIAMEVLLSFFPVQSAIRTRPLYHDSKPFDVAAKRSTVFSFSTMWFFNNPQYRKTNKLGFFSDFEYEDGFSGIIVVGDSQVEAVQVPFNKTFHQILSQKIGEPVYNIGLSGAPLSQYHAYVNEICERYIPSKILILIIPNDFKESIYSQRIRNGWFHYNSKGQVKPTPYEVSWYRRIANESALAQYLYFNLRAGNIYSQYFRNYSEKSERTYFKLQEENLKKDKVAIDMFFSSFRHSCVSKDNILFILDASRFLPGSTSQGESLYGDKQPFANIGYFKSMAKRNDYKVLDLHAIFKSNYNKQKIKFETKYDSHWTDYAHEIAAGEIFKRVTQ